MFIKILLTLFALTFQSVALADRADGIDFDSFYVDTLNARGVDVCTLGLIDALSSADSNIRATAAILLGKKREKQAVPNLKKLLLDENANVRFRAASALVRIGDLSGLNVLKRTVAETGSHITSIEAAGLLAELDDPFGYSVVVNGLNHGSAINRTRAVVEIIKFTKFDGRFVNGKEVSVLRKLAAVIERDNDKSVRVNAIYTIAKGVGIPAKPMLIKAMSDKDGDVAKAAKVGLMIIEKK